jgi:hypothetical protein
MTEYGAKATSRPAGTSNEKEEVSWLSSYLVIWQNKSTKQPDNQTTKQPNNQTTIALQQHPAQRETTKQLDN